MFFDNSKIKGKMVEMGISQKKLAKILNISIVSFNKKINNHLMFKRDEILKIIEVLKLDAEEIKEFFFTKTVD